MLSPDTNDQFGAKVGRTSRQKPPSPPSIPNLDDQTYVDLQLDWSFKKILSDSKVLVDFLNTFLPPDRKVVSATLSDKEISGDSPKERVALFDVLAKGEDGSSYIVEVQRCDQLHFTERTQFYVARGIDNQAKRGDWDFGITPVNLIAVLNFAPRVNWLDERYHYSFEMLELKNHIPLDKSISLSYVVFPKFHSEDKDCTERKDIWCHFVTPSK